MPATLPIPITFELPDGWLPVDPARLPPDTAFGATVAVAERGFTPAITVDGWTVPPDDDLAVIADRSVQRLTEATEPVTVLDRRRVGDDNAPGLVQTLRLIVDVDGTRVEAIQDQTYTLFAPADRTTPWPLIRLVFSATRAQHRELRTDFEFFVRSIALDRS